MDEMTPEAVETLIDRLLDGEPDREFRKMFRDATDRRLLARIAMNITRDRYGAGSTGARFAVVILLMFGAKAAEDFVSDLEHHEL